MTKRALIAMSGGVDSSVAAFLMKEAGYECIGITMKLFDDPTGPDIAKDDHPAEKADQGNGPAEGSRNAEKVCRQLGIAYEEIDLRSEFACKVIDPFLDCYLKGQTPNPCVECNKNLKFGALRQRAGELGCDLLVTGHYARIIEDSRGYHLMKGLDPKKDQSYVLYSLRKELLGHTAFPLASYNKEKIREIAQSQGFVNAQQKESQDICFIPDGDYRAFLERRKGSAVGPGDFVDAQGNVLGRHKGYYAYTIGQRRGLGLSAPTPWYVTGLVPEENKVILGKHEELFKDRLLAGDFNWLEEVPEDEIVSARIRYHQKETAARAKRLEDGRVAIHFLEPQRAITGGQAVVLYRGDMVLGGGTILNSQ